MNSIHHTFKSNRICFNPLRSTITSVSKHIINKLDSKMSSIRLNSKKLLDSIDCSVNHLKNYIYKLLYYAGQIDEMVFEVLKNNNIEV